MNHIAEVARLKGLEAARNPDCDHTIFAYLEALQDAAPFLLAVAGQFQAGDAHTLDVIATFFEIPRAGMTTESYAKWLEWAACLRRMLAAARVMEGAQ